MAEKKEKQNDTDRTTGQTDETFQIQFSRFIGKQIQMLLNGRLNMMEVRQQTNAWVLEQSKSYQASEMVPIIRTGMDHLKKAAEGISQELHMIVVNLK